MATPTVPTSGYDAETDGIYSSTPIVPSIIYWGIHVATAICVFLVPLTWTAAALFALTFWGRMFSITGGYHRYFAHKTYRTSRAFQLVLALLGTTSVQKGPLWWAGIHRIHHRFSDQEGDVHSPNDGFWYSHQGWIMDPKWEATPVDQIRDFARYPELRWLNRHHYVPPFALSLLCLAVGGWSGLVWGFGLSTTLLWHSTYTINSLSHRWGRQRYETGDTSRNNWVLALLTMGEGWHNNHHHYMASTRQGFFWWEVDLTYYILRGLQAIGLVWDIREPPASVLEPTAKALKEAA